MNASNIALSKAQNKGQMISFCESTLDEQRAYVWNYISNKTCLYVDWSGDISRYNSPPSMPYTLIFSEQQHTHVTKIITMACISLDVQVLVFDPFTSKQNQPLEPLFCAVHNLCRTNDITVFFMLALPHAPLIQAEVYIDPRR